MLTETESVGWETENGIAEYIISCIELSYKFDFPTFSIYIPLQVNDILKPAVFAVNEQVNNLTRNTHSVSVICMTSLH